MSRRVTIPRSLRREHGDAARAGPILARGPAGWSPRRPGPRAAVSRHAGSAVRHAGHSHRPPAPHLTCRSAPRSDPVRGTHVEDPVPAPSPVPVVFVHGLWLHAGSWTPWVDLFAHAATSPRSGLARGRGHRRGDPRRPGRGRRFRHRRCHRPLRAGHRRAVRAAGGGRSLLRRPDRPEAARHGPDPGRHRHGTGPVEGILRLPLAALKVALAVVSHPGHARRPGRTPPEKLFAAFANAVPRAETDQLLADRTGSRHRAARSSRPAWPTSRLTARRRSTPSTIAVPCC